MLRGGHAFPHTADAFPPRNRNSFSLEVGVSVTMVECFRSCLLKGV